MNKKKQIEDMADILCNAKGHDCNGGDDCRCVKQAEALYNEGYRKASEIFEDIDSLLEIDEKDFDEVFEQSRSEDEDNVSLALSNYVYGIRQIFAELKKKYTESEDTE